MFFILGVRYLDPTVNILIWSGELQLQYSCELNARLLLVYDFVFLVREGLDGW